MKLYNMTEYEAVSSSDYNNAQKAVHESVYDKTLYHLLRKEDGCIGESFLVEFGSTSTVTVKAGRAFLRDSTQVAPNPKYRPIDLASDLTLTVGAGTWAAAPTGSNKRYDIICIRPKFETTQTASRLVKTGGTGPITATTVNKIQEFTYEIAVTEGTETTGTPSVPSTPSGWMKIAEIYMDSTGIGDANDVTDVRNILYPFNESPDLGNRYVAPSGDGTDTTLASAITNLPSGGVIVIMEDITLTATHTLPSDTVLMGRGLGTRITIGASGKLVLSGRCSMRDLEIYTAETGQDMVETTGAYNVIERCRFELPAAATSKAVKLNSNQNHVGQCFFKGTVAPSTGTGISFEAGTSDNSESNNVYTP